MISLAFTQEGVPSATYDVYFDDKELTRLNIVEIEPGTNTDHYMIDAKVYKSSDCAPLLGGDPGYSSNPLVEFSVLPKFYPEGTDVCDGRIPRVPVTCMSEYCPQLDRTTGKITCQKFDEDSKCLCVSSVGDKCGPVTPAKNYWNCGDNARCVRQKPSCGAVATGSYTSIGDCKANCR